MTMPLPRDEREAASAAFFGLFTGRNTAALDVTSMEVTELRRHLLTIAGPNPHTKSGLDLAKAATILGVSRRTLERYLSEDRRPTAANADLIRQAARKAQGRAPRDPHKRMLSLLEIIGGTSKRTKSGVNTAAAAKRLGVSPGTVRRWANNPEAHPNAATQAKMLATARRMTNTKRGRTSAMREIRAHQVFDRPMTLDITAMQGPAGSATKGAPVSDYLRDRRTHFDITAEEANQLLDLYQDSGPDAVHDWVNDMLSQRYYHGGWEVTQWSVPDGGISIRPQTPTASRHSSSRLRGNRLPGQTS